MKENFSVRTLATWVVIATLGITPLIFLPVTQDYYDTNKWVILTAGACVILICTGILMVVHKNHMRIPIPAGLLAFGGLVVASIASILFASTDKVEALVHPLGAVTIIALTILVATSGAFTPKAKSYLTWALYTVVGIINLITIYQFFGMGSSMFPGLTFLQDPLWTPTGTTTTTIAISLLSLALLIPDILGTLKKSTDHTRATLLILAVFVTGAGTLLAIWQFIPKIQTGLIPFSAAWTVTLEALKSTKAAAVGVGAENFVSAYTSGKPVALVGSPLWNIRFGISADFFLHMVTVYGLIGLAASLLFAYIFFRSMCTQPAVQVIGIGILLLVPPSLTILTAFAVLFIISGPELSFTKTVPTVLRYALAICILILAAAGGYGIIRQYTGERDYFNAITAAQRNEGTNTYNALIGAIHTNVEISRYHITLSQVSLSLANSLATQTLQTATASSSETTSDRQLISQLIQQGISEAKAAVTLNPQNITAWENLGNTYQAVMQVATGSDTWAAASYQKALSMDPTNPLLMVNLGGVLVHEKKYDDAIMVLNQAIFVKPDYANAYYNLANAYNLKGDVPNAEAALTKTMSLVTPGSSDYVTAKTQLDALENNIVGTAPASTGSSILSLPQ